MLGGFFHIKVQLKNSCAQQTVKRHYTLEKTFPNTFSAFKTIFLTPLYKKNAPHSAKTKVILKFTSQNTHLPYSVISYISKKHKFRMFHALPHFNFLAYQRTPWRKKIHINIILRSVSSLHECIDFLIVEITINTTISINLVNYLLFKTSAWACNYLKMETPQQHIKLYPKHQCQTNRWHILASK